MMDRFTQEELNKEFDLIVIGGGINGCGIVRDAAERGLKVLLLEKNDFSSACTGASTRLIHGGLRYLEHFEFDLVRESLRERELLLKNANHLVKPIKFSLPVYKNDKRNFFIILLGMALYDLLSFDKSLPSYKAILGQRFKDVEPRVKDEDLVGGFVFYDSQIAFPERICIENILMAKKSGALVLNHAEVTMLSVNNSNIKHVEFFDKLNNKKYVCKGKLIVNVSGAWVDALCGLTNKNIPRKIGGTKGSHIIIKKFKGMPENALLLTASDNRPFFIIPWQNYYLIGTTDIVYEGDLNKVKAEQSEIQYLLNETNKKLKNTQIKKEDILFTYSGVRPLPYCHKSSPTLITRRHIIVDHIENGLKNFISIIGGKLTTYRELSCQVVNLAFKKLKYNFVYSKTNEIPLIGAFQDYSFDFIKAEIKKAKTKYRIDLDIISHLVNLYGKRYKAVLDLTLTHKELGYLLSSNSLDIRAQVKYAIESELAYTATDILVRRLTIGLSKGLGVDTIDYVLLQLKNYYQYSDWEIEKQKQEYYSDFVNLRVI
ncbi:MAG: glycerol-3-phosphate dehydrogenase [Candidatus Melainabacteria bacterium]|nr:glycerol-3-phosphate dehydrogenase [Candidatus Melainabacteria bacterium]